MTKLLALIFFTFTSLSSLTAEELPENKVEWIEKALKQIEDKGVDNIPKTTISSSADPSTKGEWSHSLKKNGKITFKDGSWAIIAMHSAHWGGLGDISIVQTNNGLFYYTIAHYCSSLTLSSRHSKFDNVQQFLEAIGFGPKAEEVTWTEYTRAEK